MKITYCEKWWFSKKRPLKLMDAMSARLCHESRQPYVALLGGSEQPEYIIDLSGEWVSVIFMDQQLRQYLRYDFKEKQPARLFLKTAMYWKYEGESGSEVSTKIFSFEENGHIVIEDWNRMTGEVRELETTASIEENWEDYPAFGEYLSLCQEERSVSWRQ